MPTNGKLPSKELRPVHLQSRKEFVLEALDRFERPLTAYATRLNNGDLDAARDAVQHTFLQLCKQTPEKVDHKLAPWLYTVCRNRVLDELKSQARLASNHEEHVDTVDVKAGDPANQFELAEFLQSLRQLFVCLPDPEREVLELWSHGFDASEIAGILKKNQGTVRVNLHRAIKRLKQHPQVTNWLERATGQLVRPDADQPNLGSASNRSKPSTPTITGERS